MPEAPDGYTHIEDAVAKWGHHRTWWYDRVKEGDIPGYKIPGLRGTFLRDEEVAEYLKPRPIERPGDGQNTQIG